MKNEETSEVKELLERQARWQKARNELSWPVKIRMAERVRESILRLRAVDPRRQRTEAHAKAKTPGSPSSRE